MLRGLADFVEPTQLHTFGQIFDRYLLEELPKKAERTQKDQIREMEVLRATFGTMRPSDLTTVHCARFYSKVKQRKGIVQANRIMALLSHVCTNAVGWGAIAHNPCKEIRRSHAPKRHRYVEDWEFWEVYKHASPVVKAAMKLALLTGLRPTDVLALERSNEVDDGILVAPNKTRRTTGMKILIEWTPDLRAAVKEAKELKPHVRQHLICNRRGKPYTYDGFSTLWDRAMRKALKEGKLKERFRFRDLRAKSASDDGLEAARERLGHSDSRTTIDFYRRKPVRVQPLKMPDSA
jgi:integrase